MPSNPLKANPPNAQDVEIRDGNETIDIDLRRRKVTVHHRYENLHILNDLLLAIWFFVGSIMFFYGHWVYWGTWLFVIGSFQMGIGPILRIIHKLHLRRFRQDEENIHF